MSFLSSLRPSEEVRDRLASLLEIGRITLHYGYIPLILYLGYTRSSPRPELLRLLSPLSQ